MDLGENRLTQVLFDRAWGTSGGGGDISPVSSLSAYLFAVKSPASLF